MRSLGAAPLVVDEYFIVRSVQNLLRHGLPVFDCGGLYSRGLLLQYLAALLNLSGVSLEVAPRWVSATCGVLMMPAVYIIGRRVSGPNIGLLVVIALAVSVWETELSRFGRMYVPFQAVFVWYVVCFLRRTVDGDRRAAVWLAVLTVVGALLWEGGVLLALANLLPILIRRRSLKLEKAEWLELVGFGLLLVAVYYFDTGEFRFFESVPALPSDYAAGTGDVLLNPWQATPSLWELLRARPAWLALFSVPVFAALLALRGLWLRRGADWATPVLFAALMSALAHQLVISGAILLVAALVRLTSVRQLLTPAARGVYGAIAISAAFWAAFSYWHWSAPPATGLGRLPLSFLYPLTSVPDIVGQVLRPWGGAVPRLGIELLLLLSAAVAQTLHQTEPGVSANRALLILFVLLLLATCASDAPRHETRYLFYLYPIALVLAFTALGHLVQRLVPSAAAPLAIACACVGLFMVTEDFQPSHLIRITEPAVLFRRNLSAAQQSHLVVRDDLRAIVEWVNRQSGARGAQIVSAVQGLDYYEPQVQYFYVDRSDFNFESYSCRYGTVDRWSNRPLLQSTAQLEALSNSQHDTYLVTYSARLPPLLSQLRSVGPRVALVVDHLSVVTFPGHGGRAE